MEQFLPNKQYDMGIRGRGWNALEVNSDLRS